MKENMHSNIYQKIADSFCRFYILSSVKSISHPWISLTLWCTCARKSVPDDNTDPNRLYHSRAE